MKRAAGITIAVLIAVFFIWKHIQMDMRTAPLEAQFIKIVERHAVSETRAKGGNVYQGTLDSLVAQREALVRANGYRTIGGWVSRGYRADTFTIYIWTGGLF